MAGGDHEKHVAHAKAGPHGGPHHRSGAKGQQHHTAPAHPQEQQDHADAAEAGAVASQPLAGADGSSSPPDPSSAVRQDNFEVGATPCDPPQPRPDPNDRSLGERPMGHFLYLSKNQAKLQKQRDRLPKFCDAQRDADNLFVETKKHSRKDRARFLYEVQQMLRERFHERRGADGEFVKGVEDDGYVFPYPKESFKAREIKRSVPSMEESFLRFRRGGTLNIGNWLSRLRVDVERTFAEAEEQDAAKGNELLEGSGFGAAGGEMSAIFGAKDSSDEEVNGASQQASAVAASRRAKRAAAERRERVPAVSAEPADRVQFEDWLDLHFRAEVDGKGNLTVAPGCEPALMVRAGDMRCAGSLLTQTAGFQVSPFYGERPGNSVVEDEDRDGVKESGKKGVAAAQRGVSNKATSSGAEAPDGAGDRGGVLTDRAMRTAMDRTRADERRKVLEHSLVSGRVQMEPRSQTVDELMKRTKALTRQIEPPAGGPRFPKKGMVADKRRVFRDSPRKAWWRTNVGFSEIPQERHGGGQT